MLYPPERPSAVSATVIIRTEASELMGMDPTRPHRKSNFDYVYVAVGTAVVLGLIIWALLA